MTKKMAGTVPKEQFVKMPRDLLRSDAWRSQSINCRRFVDFLLLEHLGKGGKHNGNLLAPRRQLVEFGITGHVGETLDEAVKLGLVDCIRGKGRRPNVFAITWLPMVGGIEPSNRWRSYSDNECRTASKGRALMGAETTTR